ncbi:tol-pal system YbgF family protein [Asaia astilbis]|uniref:hypothetical protein n=1 Tax=Asaia astilbis TaxID=610244 RepID=UPI000472DE10|nr:hypothetical protein [Asaia astilbis]
MRGARISRFIILSSVSLLAAGGIAPAHAQQVTSREGIALQNQIQQLSEQLQQAQANAPQSSPMASSPVPAGGASNGDLVAQLLQRVSTLENENREMRGELDQLTNQVQTQNATLAKQIGDMQFAAQNGGGGAGASAGTAPAQTPAASPTAAPPATEKPTTAIDLLKMGQAALKSRDYATAQIDASQALKLARTPNGKLESQFLLAQSLAGQKQYRDSAVAYYDAYNRAPKSPRAPEALLGVSASMLALGDKSSACQALQKLEGEFPSASPRVKAAVTSFKGRASCH